MKDRILGFLTGIVIILGLFVLTGAAARGPVGRFQWIGNWEPSLTLLVLDTTTGKIFAKNTSGPGWHDLGELEK